MSKHTITCTHTECKGSHQNVLNSLSRRPLRCAATALPQRCHHEVVAYVRPGMPDNVLPGHRGCGQTQHNSYPACRPTQPPSRRIDEHTTNRQDMSTFVVSLNRSRRSREHSLSHCFAPASLSCSLPLLGSRRTFRMRVEFHSVLSELTTLVKFDSSQQDMRVLCMSM